MKKIILIVTAFFLINASFAQKRYFTKTGNVSFRAGTAVEDIDGINKSTTCIFDAGTGDIQFAILVKGFEFKSALMMEHFNENYMESTKFPKAKFKGTIEGFKKEMLTSPVANIKITGVLNLHGVDKTITVPGTIGTEGGKLVASSKFKVTPEEFGITIPSLVRDKIGKEMEITVKATYLPYGQ